MLLKLGLFSPHFSIAHKYLFHDYKVFLWPWIPWRIMSYSSLYFPYLIHWYVYSWHSITILGINYFPCHRKHKKNVGPLKSCLYGICNIDGKTGGTIITTITATFCGVCYLQLHCFLSDCCCSNAFILLTHLILTAILGSRYYCHPYFIHEDTEIETS